MNKNFAVNVEFLSLCREARGVPVQSAGHLILMEGCVIFHANVDSHHPIALCEMFLSVRAGIQQKVKYNNLAAISLILLRASKAF